MDEVSRAVWERRAQREGWSGSLRLTATAGGLSNGPTTDICGGIFG